LGGIYDVFGGFDSHALPPVQVHFSVLLEILNNVPLVDEVITEDDDIFKSST